MKNELLAIMAQTEFLEHMCEKSPEVVQEVQIIEHRCRKIYDRLDVVHQKTMKSQLELEPVALHELMENRPGEMSLELMQIKVNYTRHQRHLVIMADPYYSSQAVENILSKVF